MGLITTYWLTVIGVHTRFDLRVNPQRRSFLHGAQQERLEVQEHFVVSFSIFGRLVRNDCCKISIPASDVGKNKKTFTVIIVTILSYAEYHGRGIWSRTNAAVTGSRAFFFYSTHYIRTMQYCIILFLF